MKYNTVQLVKMLGVLLVAVSAFVACNNEQNDLGLGVLPEEDLINVRNISVSDKIASFTFSESNLVSNQASVNLLGSFKDPVFGKTTAHFASQFRLTEYPDFGTNPVVDSVRLYIFYRNIYGDTLTTQRLKVYEMESDLLPATDVEYTQDIDLKSMASTVPLAEFDFNPKVELDSATQDTNYQLLTIPLANSLGEKLIGADSLDMINNDVFLQYFKGLYIESEDVSGEGALINIHTLPTSTFQGSALLVYFNNDENTIDLEDDEEPDTMSQAYLITSNSARVSAIVHDYTGTPFLENLDSEDVEEDLVYVQPTGGLKSRITITGLESWKDSVNMGINKAEIVFHVDTIASDIHNYPPPSQLLFTFVAPDGEEYQPIDYFFNPTYYGGYLDTSDYTYSFNITQHVQRIIDVTDPEDDLFVGNQGFYVTTGKRVDIANRVILKSAKDDGVQMRITYTKFLE
ncbi:DUF4270 domain-containing protein [Draconibacterium sp. IB214405]|uniref:DUF4270 domain-containing protein n=1 Tax=Draconibacterium sp. IB214405 TaxID=3097352 RepID=UPI002A10D46D|nr:DUF4270 domain-containing protein [Draconibacterium sp. IB214405]MDX8338262.1 DUF4270 domain-containing protein [Draconibacterium sp. IB214405]